MRVANFEIYFFKRTGGLDFDKYKKEQNKTKWHLRARLNLVDHLVFVVLFLYFFVAFILILKNAHFNMPLDQESKKKYDCILLLMIGEQLFNI